MTHLTLHSLFFSESFRNEQEVKKIRYSAIRMAPFPKQPSFFHFSRNSYCSHPYFDRELVCFLSIPLFSSSISLSSCCSLTSKIWLCKCERVLQADTYVLFTDLQSSIVSKNAAFKPSFTTRMRWCGIHQKLHQVLKLFSIRFAETSFPDFLIDFL